MVDYEALAVWIGSREVTVTEIAAWCGVSYQSAFHVIDTLSINYTLYACKRGYYKMLRPVIKKEGN